MKIFRAYRLLRRVHSFYQLNFLTPQALGMLLKVAFTRILRQKGGVPPSV